MTVSISTQSAGQLLVRPARELAGLIEVRGLGIRRCDFASEAVVGLVVDLAAGDAERLPPPEALSIRPKWCLITANPRWNRLCAPPAGCSRADDNRKFIFRPTFG